MMLLESRFFQVSAFSPRKLKKDFIDYCIDLQKIESGVLQFSDNVGFSFAELFELFLASHGDVNEWLLIASVIVVVHESYEYDPDYSHVVAYILNKFKLSAEVIAIISLKETLLDNAKNILSAYLLEDNQVGLIIQFEQAVLPLRMSSDTKEPEFSSVSVLKFSGSCGAHLKILA